MNTIENLLSSTIEHVFPTGTLMIGFATDKTTLNIKFTDKLFNSYLYTVKQEDKFVSNYLNRDLNRFMTFFENKDKFEFNSFNTPPHRGYLLKLIYPINLEFILKKIHIEADYFRKLLIESKNEVFRLGEENISLKRKFDELEQENSKLENHNTGLLKLNESLKQNDTSSKRKIDELEQEISTLKSSIYVSDSDFEKLTVKNTEVKRGRGRPRGSKNLRGRGAIIRHFGI